jgi:hypothetical protein
MYRQVGIFVDDIHKYVTDRQRHSKFLLTFTNERLLFCFANFNLATNELPEEATRLVHRTLAYHEFITIPNKGGYYFSHFHISSIPKLFKY